MRTRNLIMALAAPLALAACSDDLSGPDFGEADGEVAIQFSTAASLVSSQLGGGALLTPNGDLVIGGDNGSLEITELRLIVEEFELDGDDDVVRCDGDDCEDFDTGPLFITLPLDGSPVIVASGVVPEGVYDELEFEVDDLDDDEENAAERQRIAEVLAEVRGAIPDWPRDASMLVAGRFNPAGGGAAVPFRVFFEAEIEIELELAPPLVVGPNSTERVEVTLDPDAWFRARNGDVIDLSRFQGRLVEFEFEMEDGFRAKHRVDGDEDDEEEDDDGDEDEDDEDDGDNSGSNDDDDS